MEEGDDEDGRFVLVEVVDDLVLGSIGGESMLTSVLIALVVVGVVAVWCLLSLPPLDVLMRAGGGSSNAICRFASSLEPSWP